MELKTKVKKNYKKDKNLRKKIQEKKGKKGKNCKNL